MNGIKPLETVWNGYRFRSRLEARWSVCFDALGVAYDYEREGFDLGPAGWYLPDFWLPSLQTWIEVKGEYPSQPELDKVETFARYQHLQSKSVALLVGSPWAKVNEHGETVGFDYVLYAYSPSGTEKGELYRWPAVFTECRRCGAITYEDRGSHTAPNRISEGGGWGCCSDRMGLPYTERLQLAYRAARQARFEHRT